MDQTLFEKEFFFEVVLASAELRTDALNMKKNKSFIDRLN